MTRDDLAAALERRIRSRTATVGIIGLGYVGLPLAIAFAERGFPVLGFDVDAGKAERIARGECYIRHLDGGRLAAVVEAGRLAATTEFARLGEPDAILICVPTPLSPQREPDMRYVEGTAREIAARLRRGQLVVLESTTYPGTTDGLLREILESSGLAAGTDFFLAFSPEREDPGNPDWGTTTIPKVVGGVDPVSGDLAETLYAQVVARTVRVSSARAAEATKLMENIFRAVNIALVNELKVVYDRMGIDIWEVLDAAETKPFGFMRFDPGPGWGGHCLDGSEWVRVRGRGLAGVYRLEQLYRLLRDSCEVVITRQGLYVQTDGLEALAIDPRTGERGWFPVTTLYRGRYDGPVLTVRTDGNRTLTVTPEHPMLVYRDHRLETVPASHLHEGDRLPVLSDCGDRGTPDPVVDLLEVVPEQERTRVWVRPVTGSWSEHSEVLKRHFGWKIRDSIRSNALRLDRFIEIESQLPLSRAEVVLLTGVGRARRIWPSSLRVTPAVARLVGYYLSEGCVTEDGGSIRVRWTFSRGERDYIEDALQILRAIGFPGTTYQDRTWYTTTIKVSSLLLGWLVRDHWRCGQCSTEMRVPDLFFDLGLDHKRELLKGLLRGDGDVWVRSGRHEYVKRGRPYSHANNTAVVGYFSSSSTLLEQTLQLLQDLGFYPRLKKGSPQLRMQGAETVEALTEMFLGEKRLKLEAACAARRRRVTTRARKARVASGLAAMRVTEVRSERITGHVYSLEVKGARSFTASGGIAVHNCIPLDPFYLSWKAREYGVTPRFIELAGEVNVAMPRFVIEKLTLALNERGRPVKGSRVLVLGLAYKRDIDDPRESPAFELIHRLLELGAEVSYHDPHIPVAPRMRSWPDLPPLESVPLTAGTLRTQDAVVIATDHTAVDYDLVAREAPLVVDTRGVYREPRPNVVKA